MAISNKSHVLEVDPWSTSGSTQGRPIFHLVCWDGHAKYMFHVRVVDSMRPTTWSTQRRPWVDPGTRGVLKPVTFWVDPGLTRGRPIFHHFWWKIPISKTCSMLIITCFQLEPRSTPGRPWVDPKMR